MNYLPYVSIIMACIGILIVLIRRSAITALIGIELILNAANLNLIFWGYLNPNKAQSASLFIIVVAAAQAAVGLAIILNVYKKYKTTDLNFLDKLAKPKSEN